MKKIAVENTKNRKIPERLVFEREGIERDGELLVDSAFTDIALISYSKKFKVE